MMKNPVHQGKLAEANLEELGLSVAEAAKAMKVMRQQLFNVMRGKCAISPNMAFGGGAAMWLGVQSAYDLAQARKEEGKIMIRILAEHHAASAFAGR